MHIVTHRGWSNFAQFAMVALGFWWGGKLMVKGEITLVQLLKSFFAILFAGIGAAQAQIVRPSLSLSICPSSPT